MMLLGPPETGSPSIFLQWVELFREQYERVRGRVMGFCSGGIVPSAGAKLQLSAHAPPPSEGQLNARRGTCIAFAGFNGHAAWLAFAA
jgi:hypothetical protein